MMDSRSNLKIWNLVKNTGFLELVSIMIANSLKNDKVGSIISAEDPYSIALSSLLATKLRSDLCIVSNYYLDDNLYVGLKRSEGKLQILALPKECIDRKKVNIFIKFCIRNSNELREYMDFLMKLNLIRYKFVVVLSYVDDEQVNVNMNGQNLYVLIKVKQ